MVIQCYFEEKNTIKLYLNDNNNVIFWISVIFIHPDIGKIYRTYLINYKKEVIEILIAERVIKKL